MTRVIFDPPSEAVFWNVFWFFSISCILINWMIRYVTSEQTNKNKNNTIKRPPSRGSLEVDNPRFVSFQLKYLTVYLIAMTADWLQGPYAFSLLQDEYGYSTSNIALVSLTGFGSSAIFGTFIGGITDQIGRKKGCLAFCILYALSCFTKIFPSLFIQLMGKFLSGIATSLLFSVFEAWMLSEHNRLGFGEAQLSSTFSRATFGNGIVSILAGLVSSLLVENYGLISPFMASMVLLILLSGLTWSLWEENFGDSTINFSQGFSNALSNISSQNTIIFVGCIQSLFEGSMYTFVFMWVPVLAVKSNIELPFGVIFATFMVCIMIGSSLFSWYTARGHSAELILLCACFLSMVSFMIPCVMEEETLLNLFAFCIFELCVGVYFPTIGTLRSKYIPESSRSSIMNLFRIPLNLMVVAVFCAIIIYEASVVTVFSFCIIALFIATFLALALVSGSSSSSSSLPSQTIRKPAQA